MGGGGEGLQVTRKARARSLTARPRQLAKAPAGHEVNHFKREEAYFSERRPGLHAAAAPNSERLRRLHPGILRADEQAR